MVDASTDKSAMTIADRIRHLRKEHGLTQEDLAAKSGLGVATIQRMERGEAPSAASLSSLAAAFTLTVEGLTSFRVLPTSGSRQLAPISRCLR